MKKSVLLVLFIMISCNKLPIGEEELNLRGDFTAHYIEFSPYVTLTEYKNIVLGFSGNLIVGKNSAYESRILLKFSFPDSIEQGLDEIKLILKQNSKFKNDLKKFSIHLLTNTFEETEATWHKRTGIEYWLTPGGDFEEDSLRFGEMGDDSLVVLFNYIELDQIRAADGLVIIPEDSGFVGFHSKESGIIPEFHLVKNSVVTTVHAQEDCHILIGPEPFYIENWIGTGMAYRNFTIFNFDTILQGKKAVYAELTFTASEYFSMRDSVEIAVKELVEPFDDFDTQTGPLIALEKFAIDDTLFSLDIVKHVQHIIEHPDSNFGFFIYLSPENYDISNMKLTSNSHHLKVGYVLPPDER